MFNLNPKEMHLKGDFAYVLDTFYLHTNSNDLYVSFRCRNDGIDFDILRHHRRDAVFGRKVMGLAHGFFIAKGGARFTPFKELIRVFL